MTRRIVWDVVHRALRREEAPTELDAAGEATRKAGLAVLMDRILRQPSRKAFGRALGRLRRILDPK